VYFQMHRQQFLVEFMGAGQQARYTRAPVWQSRHSIPLRNNVGITKLQANKDTMRIPDLMQAQFCSESTVV